MADWEGVKMDFGRLRVPGYASRAHWCDLHFSLIESWASSQIPYSSLCLALAEISDFLIVCVT